MLLQTNSYIVPKDKRAEHQRLIRRFRQTLKRLGCDHFEVYEQVGPNWSASESSGRYVQILRFVDRKHQLSVQTAERSDPTAQAVIADFCDLINFPYQQQQGLFAVGFYNSVLPVAPKRGTRGELISTVEHEVIDEPEAETGGGIDDADVMAASAVALEAELAADASVEHTAVAAAMADDAAPANLVVERRHEMIDSVFIDDPTTAPGALHDVLAADAPVDGLDGTPAETELVTADLRHVPPGTFPDAAGTQRYAAVHLDQDDDEHDAANGFVLEDAAEAGPQSTNRPQW